LLPRRRGRGVRREDGGSLDGMGPVAQDRRPDRRAQGLGGGGRGASPPLLGRVCHEAADVVPERQLDVHWVPPRRVGEVHDASPRRPLYDQSGLVHHEPHDDYTLRGFPWERVYPVVPWEGSLLLSVAGFTATGIVDLFGRRIVPNQIGATAAGAPGARMVWLRALQPEEPHGRLSPRAMSSPGTFS